MPSMFRQRLLDGVPRGDPDLCRGFGVGVRSVFVAKTACGGHSVGRQAIAKYDTAAPSPAYLTAGSAGPVLIYSSPQARRSVLTPPARGGWRTNSAEFMQRAECNENDR